MSIIIELGRGAFLLIRQPTRGDPENKMSNWQLVVRRNANMAEVEFEKLPAGGIPESKWLSEQLGPGNVLGYWDEIGAVFDLLRLYYPDGRTLLKGVEELTKRGKQ